MVSGMLGRGLDVLANTKTQANRKRPKRVIPYSKYKSRKITIDGITYDSMKEAKRHQELLILEKQGIISNLQRQVKFVLIPAQREPDTIGKRGGIHKGKIIERECAYIADFTYSIPNCNTPIVEDTKGFRTKDYIIKRKLMLYIHKIKIKEI